MEQVHVGSACSDSSSGVEVSMDSSGAIPVKAGENTMPIAIIGMSCRFPGDATSPEKLWKLCAESRSAWSQVPSERFNQKAFYHPQAENLGTSNVAGAHFLSEDVALFDASFFNFTSEVASTMDPQFRLQLETVFEAFENAGMPLESVAGSDTSVFAGAFFRDYHDSLMRDPGNLPRYFMTGNGAAMAANRLSHFFDLKGPSITVDTGCSTALAALHLACQSLRTGDASMSVVGGANVMLNPDMFVSMSSLGFLSPDGKSYAFDSRANGYGRGEGIATIILKPLCDAVRDNDPVQAVIRATALNQDGRTPTLTSPSRHAQESLIRTCYGNAGLDPLETCYVEAHGTGTKAGDLAEAGAIGSTFGLDRPHDRPLYVGSVKTNIGHTEAASGLAAVIKVARSLHHGLIPPSLNFEKPNEKTPLDQWRIKIPTTLTAWPSCEVRRASISNFGYGGTNAHVVLEEASGLRPRHTSQEIKMTSDGAPSNPAGPRVFCLSAKDNTSTSSMMSQLELYLCNAQIHHEGHFLDDLAYTLGLRRSHFQWIIATPARSIQGLIDSLKNGGLRPNRVSDKPRLGFVFTGQGAQWYAMGRELFHTYPVYRASLLEGERYLKSLGAKWSLIDELLRPKETSRVDEAAMSLVLCTAVQIALVRLLASWDVKPSAVTGHSSGEIGAAFTAGVLDHRSALAIAYLRGTVAIKGPKQSTLKGGMIAVGLGKNEAESYFKEIRSGKVVVACVNSPSSVTVSGDLCAIDELEYLLTSNQVFARKLKVPLAYHSHHMIPFVEDYTSALRETLGSPADLRSLVYSSPVTGQRITSSDQLGHKNWVQNMVQPVLFLDSFRNMCLERLPESQETKSVVDIVLEIGPHGALAGPIRQIMNLPEFGDSRISYLSCLSRERNAVETMQDTAAFLLTRGYRVDLNAVNFPNGKHDARVIADLPSYPWNHATRHWAEPYVNAIHRTREHAYHDLLGLPALFTNPFTSVWRHFIRAANIPWIGDHRVQSNIVYPAAGFISMAIEAARLKTASVSHSISGFELRDVDVLLALIVPDTPEGIEVQLSFRRCSDKFLLGEDWQEFEILSIDHNRTWKRHCRGLISALLSSSRQNSVCADAPLRDIPAVDGTRQQRQFSRVVDPKEFYQSLQSVGIHHGPAFQNILSIEVGGDESMTLFKIADIASSMPHQYLSDHLLHPTTLDSMFQSAYSALPDAERQHDAMVPKTIKRVFVASGITRTPGHRLASLSHLHSQKAQGFRGSMAIFNGSLDSGPPVVEVEELYCQSLGGIAAKSSTVGRKKLCMTLRWDLDISQVRPQHMKSLLKQPTNKGEIDGINDMRKIVYLFICQALTSLDDSDAKSFSKEQEAFYRWMRLQRKLGDLDLLGHESSVWGECSELEMESLSNAVRKASVNGEMLCLIGTHLADILRGKVAALELMLQNRLLYLYYENDFRMQRAYVQAKTIATLFAHKVPRARVLEIGAGTGGCTTAVLQALAETGTTESPALEFYDFTDVSSGFFEAARAKFASWGGMINYRRFDVEIDPSSQGFEDGTYDLIVACRVLHATRRMSSTMKHVRRLLKPGGKLLLVEDTRDALDTQLIFGVLPGWWLSEEEERKFSPTLPVLAWQRLLKETGFNGIDVEAHDREDEETYSTSVMLATADDVHTPQYDANVVLVYGESPPPNDWLARLSEAIAKLTSRMPTVEPLEKLNPRGRTCIVLIDIWGDILTRPSPRQFQAMQGICTRARAVLWLSRGGVMQCPRPEASLHTGLLRTLRCEDNDKRYVSLDLDPDLEIPGSLSIKAIADVFAASFDNSRAVNQQDLEFAERNGSIYIPRICEDETENAAIMAGELYSKPEMQHFHQEERPLRMEAAAPGSIDSLSFRLDPTALDALPDDFVEIRPRAFGLNFRDVMVALGQLDTDVMGFECAGIITRVGHSVPSGLRVGDRVCALIRGYWSASVRVHFTSVASIGNKMSFEMAASIPMAFITAFHSLYDIAHLQSGETLLIHAAAGGVGQAAIILAQHLGAHIYATVGSTEKRDFLITTYGIPSERIFSSRDSSFATGILSSTAGKGVNVILNSLAGPLLQESWNCIARFGRFVEIGKRDLESNKHLQMAPFTRGATFSAVDLIQLGTHSGPVIAHAIAEVLSMIQQDAIRPVQPITVFPLEDLKNAFRMMQTGKHIGKIIVKPADSNLVKVMPSKMPLELSADASYLIVGGFGGIGRSISKYLVRHGVRNLILLSRNASRDDSDGFLSELRSQGCHIATYSCDIADAGRLTDVFRRCKMEMPPIRGLIQAAMVLKDSIFEAMTLDEYLAAIRPKVQGSWNLHAELAQMNIQFFIMLASFAAVGGNSGQANYAAGGTYQDALARFRVASGLPAVTIDLGIVKSVGYVAETKGVENRLTKMGYRPIEEAEVLRLIESAIRNPLRTPQASQVITGITAGFEGDTTGTPWRKEPRFASMRKTASAGPTLSSSSNSSVINLKEQLQSASSLADATVMVSKAIAQKISDMFLIPLAEIDNSMPLTKYGIDSLVAVELRNWVMAHTQAETSIFDVIQSSSIEALASKTAKNSKCIDSSLTS